MKYEIHAMSEIIGKLAPTAHGTFPTRAAAEQYARENIRHTEFKVVPVS